MVMWNAWELMALCGCLKLCLYYQFYKYPAYSFYLFCGCFLCDDRVFTREQIMLQVIELRSEKLDDENILFPFEYLF